MDLIAAGTVRIDITEVVPLAGAGEAHQWPELRNDLQLSAQEVWRHT